LRNDLPALEKAASDFSQKYDRNTENAVLDRRKRAMLLNRNVDRVGNVLELPSLLSSTIGSASAGNSGPVSGSSASGYASALDIHAHVKRLKALYPDSDLISDISQQADEEIQNLITILITGLQSPGLKLAGAMRTIGWLRRVAPDLASSSQTYAISDVNRGLDSKALGSEEGSLGAMYLVCRLVTLRRTLEALAPLRELADQETSRRGSKPGPGDTQGRWTEGIQTERYLKRFIEVFREQSFSIISMYKSVFPTALPTPGVGTHEENVKSPVDTIKSPISGSASTGRKQEMENMPSALASFTPRLVEILLDTLSEYLPNVTDRSSRDSLLTQVLYCAGSLGRLGADFGMMLALLDDRVAEQQDEPEWVQVMQKHKVQASRLELLASGVGGSRKGSTVSEIRSPTTVSPA